MPTLINPNLSTRLAMFGPTIDEVEKLYTAALNSAAAYDGISIGISLKKARAYDFAEFDRIVTMLPEGQVLRVSITVTPADPSAGYDFVTVPLRVLKNPPVDTPIAVMWGPKLEGDFIDAFQTVYDHLEEDLGIAQRLEGFTISGICARLDGAEFSLCSDNRDPYEDLSQPWLDAGFSPDLVAGVLTRVAVGVAAIKPGQLMVFCMPDPSLLTLGGHNDHGVWAKSLMTSMRDAVSPGTRLVPMYESARPGRAVPPVLLELAQMCDGIALQEEQGYVFNDPVPGALYIERHITDLRPGFVDQAGGSP